MFKQMSKILVILVAFLVLITQASSQSFGGHKTVVKNGDRSAVAKRSHILPKSSISFEPDALEATVNKGETTTAVLTLINGGTSDVTFSLHEVGDSSSVLQPAGSKRALKPLNRGGSRTLTAKKKAQSPLSSVSWPSDLLGAYGVAYTNFDDNGTLDDNGTVWVSSDDEDNSTISGFSPSGLPIETSYEALSAMSGARDLTCNWNNGYLWVMDSASPSCIYEIDPSQGFTKRKAVCPSGLTEQNGLAYDPVTNTFFSGGLDDTKIHQFRPNGTMVSEVSVSLRVAGLAFNPQTGHLFVLAEEATTLTPSIHVLDIRNGYNDIEQISIPEEFTSAGGLEIDCNGSLWAVDKTSGIVYQLDSGEQTNVCSLDVPWLSEDATSGSIPASGSLDVTVTFDTSVSAIANAGVYTAQLKVKTAGNEDSFISVTMTVENPNTAPVLDAIGNKPVNELSELTFTATATDPESNALTFSLGSGAPDGAEITEDGLFTWTPTEGQGPGSYQVTVRVTDDGDPQLSDSEKITITVKEVNEAPRLTAIGKKTVDELTKLTFTATATDLDRPRNALTFSLGSGAPDGAEITEDGLFTWTPTEGQGPGSYQVTVRVTDDGVPPLSDSEKITITVKEVNSKPVLDQIGDKTVYQLETLTFRATATDKDDNTLAFSLGDGAPDGAAINARTGAFAWTPTKAQKPGSYQVTVRVTDDGDPQLSDSEKITITVKKTTNRPPVLDQIGDKTVYQLKTLTFRATATDPDDDALAFSLGDGAPDGAAINARTGAFAWTPAKAQKPGDYEVTVRVTDDGDPQLSDSEKITITVKKKANSAPVATGKTITTMKGKAVTDTLEATDADGDSLTYSTVKQPQNGTISLDSTNGRFTYTPRSGFTGKDSFTFKASDGHLDSNIAKVTITVKAK